MMDPINRLFSSKIEGLTEAQKKAVCHRDGPLLILAGPGSGKTRVITHRIAALIQQGIAPWNICAITFTNKAADEMRERVEAMGIRRGVHVSTFHSLCVRILRQYAEYAGLRPNFSIYDESDQKRVIKEATASVGVDASRFPPARMLAAVSNCKNDLETPEDVAQRAGEYFTQILAKVYPAYQKRLADNNALDFDDLLVKTAFLLRNQPQIRIELSDRYRYLLVDEYQDTNHAQYQIAKGLALAHGNLCVTGDPDQSIYRWRGADIENILAFEKDWPNATVIKLEENFRSRPHILQLADKLIAFNVKRKIKSLIPTRQDVPDDTAFHCAQDENEEARFVAGAIREKIDAGIDANEMAVFYRVNSMSRVIEEAFVREQIPYQVVRGIEFYNRKEIRDMLGYLKLIANPQDDMAFLRAIDTHPRGIGKTTIERVQAFAVSHRLSLDEAARQAGRIDSVAKTTQNKIVAFASLIDKLRKGADGPVGPFIQRVFQESGYGEHLSLAGPKEESAIENIEELINAASQYDQITEAPSLADWLQTIALYSDTDAYHPDSGKVSLMTLHAAKGLEFDHVFIIGLEDGLLPHERSMEKSDDLEEERRLFFVGITRARDNVTITLSRYRTLRGQMLRTTPSQFLFEIGYDDQDDFIDGYDPNTLSRDTDYGQDADEEKKPVYALNQLVKHHKFGLGRVKEFIDLGPDSIIVVRFNSGQIKTLMLKYANLEKVVG
ncbi:MAG: UvrD-helicase domain-containing protein [Sedimentisphaerales bacterium]|nr:UvrD-helicase domain-containing protein [Sedimentisphaerales bacterium]